MEKKPMGSFGVPGQTNALPNVDPLDYPSVKCPHCGSEVFVPGVIFKEIPGVLLGQADTVAVPIKVFVCSKCGALSPDDEKILNEHAKVKEAADKNKLIM